tara:strand:- start:420 stop:1352 length:933 start_codon:yes stop_codon:yes gene_type:complete
MKVRQNEIGESKASEADQSEVSDYLDMLRESGVTNMFGAGSYIEEEFGVSRQEARKFLQNWMENFGKASETDPCWKGYKQVGMKDKDGKQVPNCVPNSNEGHHDDGCWTCGTEIAFDKKYCQYHCYHEDFDDFTGKCRDCGQKLPLAMMVESEGDSDYCEICGDFDESHYNEDGSVRDHEFKSGGTSNEGLIDNIEKELLRFGINLDKDPDQVAESKASEDYYNKTAEDYADMVEGEEPEPDEDLMKGVDVESKASEGFYQGLHGYVDAKCKTCGGLEFGSIEDMNDHFAMNSDHISNLDDLDNDIPNSD